MQYKKIAYIYRGRSVFRSSLTSLSDGPTYSNVLRTVPPKYKGFCARVGPRAESRSFQRLLESIKKNWGSGAFFEIISLESHQKC